MGRKRVVAYVRVSSSSKAQLHSYEFQEQYWRSKFENDPDNELVRIYADRGISGSNAYKRPEFMSMMKDARNRKFDVIHTKSVSRFARNILKMISNEKYMGDVMMGKSVNIDGKKCDNLDGQYGERYYIEDAHEGIISKETYYKAMELRQQRANPKLVNQETVEYPFTRKIACGCCGSYFRHKVNNPGKKWANGIWICARQEQKGKAHCDSTRIKDTVLKEKFVEAYNEFVTLRPQGETIDAIQADIQRLRVQEDRLAALLMRKLIAEKAFRTEQQSIKAEIRRLQEQLQQLRCSAVRESDYTRIAEFDEAKLKLFVEKIIIMEEKRVVFRFFNGVEITKEYTNGKSGNKPGWNLKEE